MKRTYIVALSVGELRIQALDISGGYGFPSPEGALISVACHVILQLASHECRALARLHVHELCTHGETRFLSEILPDFHHTVCSKYLPC